MKKILFKKTIAVIAMVTVSVAMVACNGETESTPAPEGENTEAAAVSEGDMVKVGVNQFAPHPSLDNCYKGFVDGMAEKGFVEGENVEYDFRNAQADTAMSNQISKSFTSRDYNIILGIATPSAQSAFNNAMDTDIPVIFSACSDPVSAGIVESLEVPGNNVTGTADTLPVENQLKMIREFMPDAKKIGIIYTLSEVNSQTQIETYEKLAPEYGFEIVKIGVNESKDIQPAIDKLLKDVDCITNVLDNTVVTSLPLIVEKATAAGVPVFGSEEEQLKAGCVATEGIDYYELGVQTGYMAADVLNGADARKMPVMSFTDSKPYVNPGACETLGLTIPETYKDATIVE